MPGFICAILSAVCVTLALLPSHNPAIGETGVDILNAFLFGLAVLFALSALYREEK